MTTQTEALKIALEAMERFGEEGTAERYIKAKAAIKEALAQQSNEQVEPVAIYQYQSGDGSWFDQEKHNYDYNVKHGVATVRIVYTHLPVPTAQPKEPEQEPVAWYDTEEYGNIRWASEWSLDEGTPLYTTPPQRKPLTDEQISGLRQQHGITSDGRGIKEWTQVVDFARAIEAAHGIKE